MGIKIRQSIKFPKGIKNKWRIDPGIFLFLYMCIPVLTFAFRFVLSKVGLASFAVPIVLTIVYFPLIICCFISKKFIVKDFIVLLAFLTAFLGVTILVHPEYEPWYSRSDLGVWNYVLRPDNGLYIYLFLRLVNDPKKILKYIKLSALPMYLYFGYRLIMALRRGYWDQEDANGQTIKMAYNLSFGYDVLIFDLVFLYEALEKKKMFDWIGAGIGLLMIMLGGSRGPFLNIAIFFALYILIKVEKSKKKGLIITGLVAAVGVLLLLYERILLFVATVFEKLNLSARIITTLIDGSVAEDNGREAIWNAAIEMIKNNPFGYGAMGTRHVVGHVHYVGHPHQFFLEFLVDYGVVIGGILLIYFAYKIVKILNMKNNEVWKGVFIIFLARFSQLLLSLTYWHSIGFWGVLAIGVCIQYSSSQKIGIKELLYGKQQNK